MAIIKWGLNNDLTNQLNQNNNDSQDLSQAIKEAQDTRDHADTDDRIKSGGINYELHQGS